MKRTFLLMIMLSLTIALLSEAKSQKMLNFKLTDLNGKNYELQKMLGKGPIIIDFWATWCEPCLKELPDLSKLQSKYREDSLTVIAISVDKVRMINKVKRIVKSHNYKFLTLLDKNGNYQRKLNINNIPQTFLLNKNGNIIYRHEGFNKESTSKLEQELKKLLTKKRNNLKLDTKSDPKEEK